MAANRHLWFLEIKIFTIGFAVLVNPTLEPNMAPIVSLFGELQNCYKCYKVE